MNFKNISQPVRTFSITDAEGSGPLPSRQPAAAAGGKTKWIAVGAALAVLLAGGGFWAYTVHQRSNTEKARVAVSASQAQGTVPAPAIPRAKKPDPAGEVKPPAAARPAPAGKPRP